MPVRDLVGLYESSAATSSSSRTVKPASYLSPKEHSSSDDHSHSLPRPIHARFLKHGTTANNSSRHAITGIPEEVSEPPFTTSSMNTHDDLEISMSSLDITDLTERTAQIPSLKYAASATSNHFALPRDGYLSDNIEKDDQVPTSTYIYPPLPPQKQPSSSASTLVQRPLPHHTPVPATVVFARGAAPLYLPQLDNYLASLPPPIFPTLKGKERAHAMFPPMDRLAASGKTLEDLELNSKPLSAWDRQSILGSLVNVILGLTGSSMLATFYSLQGLLNTVQIFALILSTIIPVGGRNLGSEWRKLFLGTIPNVLALNFASTLVQSILFLLIFMAITAILLLYFYRSTFNCERYNVVEGLQKPEPKGNQWGIVIVTFLLTVIYLPLSTMAVHVLVWSQDLWVVPNPYVNATTFPPIVSPLGPPSEFRDALDFCWTTTMERNEVNFAPMVIVISSVVFLSLTLWFPICLRRVIQQSVPAVDPYTELGRPRSRSDMDHEYQRLLSRDINPFAFLYNGFRRNWGTYESAYLFAKLSTLFIVAVIDPDNCLFRSLSRSRVTITRQVLLLMSTIAFFLVQCFLAPFLDPVNNASEWTSRINYVLTAALALAVALNIPGKDILNTYVLYIVYIITYGLSFYFTIINLSVMQRFMKKLTRRIDFSIDIFSPRLDLSPSSLHTRRRIWQESITALLLTSAECKIPLTQHMNFAQARDSEFPPYLLAFAGTPGERHVENLKILREVGSFEYHKAISLVYGPDFAWFRYLADEIQKFFVGPDSYWKKPTQPALKGCTNFFGNAWWIPFPPTLVIRYDDGPFAVLREISDLEAYITQNSSHDIQRRREIRMSLRALDGQIVKWPYEHIQLIGTQTLYCCERRYKAQTSTFYKYCVMRIKRRGHLLWQDLQLGSGFDLELTYAKNVKVDGDIIGLNDDFDLTAPLARFLTLNQDLIPERLAALETTLASYRRHHKKVCRVKDRVLTYRFLSYVYDQPREPTGLAESSIEFEHDLRVRQLMVGSEAVFQAAYERLAVVSATEAATWWYIFWDDLWRRNFDTISALQLHAVDFNPHYPTSIAYTPLPRPVLEAFLIQRGLMSKVPRWGDFFTTGFLNKIYLRLNEAVFARSGRAIMFHVGYGHSELDMEDVDFTQGQSSTLGTGGGTDHDDESIRPRPTYRWEGLLSDPLRHGKRRERRMFAKMGAWFGITPLWKSSISSKGVALDVRLYNGRYVVIDNEE